MNANGEPVAGLLRWLISAEIYPAGAFSTRVAHLEQHSIGDALKRGVVVELVIDAGMLAGIRFRASSIFSGGFPFAEHLQFAPEGSEGDFRRVAILSRLILPFAGFELTLNVHSLTFGQVLLGNPDQVFVVDRNPVPFGSFTVFAGVSVAPAFRRGNRQIAVLRPGRKSSDFGIPAKIADENDLVYTSGHRFDPINSIATIKAGR